MPRTGQPLRPWLALACALAFVMSGDHLTGRATGSVDVCRTSYLYAGVEDAVRHNGVRASLTTVRNPEVAVGQAAGWIGVGGPGLGPGGTDEWLQTGFVAFQTGERQLYYEVTQPNQAPRYHTVLDTVKVGQPSELTVLEVASMPSHWRAWVGRQPVSPPISLPNSHGRFRPQLMGEAWNAGTLRCNDYAYRFTGIRVSTAPGGGWRRGKSGFRFQQEQYRAVKIAPDGFVAFSSAFRVLAQRDRGPSRASRDVPPLLGTLGARLARRPLTARCTHRQQAAFRWLPSASTLRLRQDVCEILLGYLVSHPWRPSARSPAGGQVLERAFAFARGAAVALRLQGRRADCQASATLEQLLKGLGATRDMATAFHERLLDERASLRRC